VGFAVVQLLSAEHDEKQEAAAAQTFWFEAWFAWQHASPAAVLHVLSSVQKRGHADGATHACESLPKSQQSCPSLVQSESAEQSFGQLSVQIDEPLGPGPGPVPGVLLFAHATIVISAANKVPTTAGPRNVNMGSLRVDVRPGSANLPSSAHGARTISPPPPPSQRKD
jgi:hypothetical protein